MKSYQIGELSSLLGLSADTLRYYEKIGLLPPVTRSASGLRLYDDKDVSIQAAFACLECWAREACMSLSERSRR
jgi:DNA-binding transcriptional MerR regulator